MTFSAINKYEYRKFGGTYIELPKQIKDKKACVNVKNDDDSCFAWAVMSALYPAEKHSDRMSSYPPYMFELKLERITFPMTIGQIPLFERQNKISINVFTLKKQKNKFSVNSCFLTKNKRERHVNLLLIQERYSENDENDSESDDPINYHFVWIKDLSRLVSSQLNRTKGKKYICERCLNYFHSQDKFDKHTVDCQNMNECKIRMPTKENNIFKFKNYQHKIKQPFIIFADLESLLIPEREGSKMNTQKYQDHRPCSIGYFVKCDYDNTLSFYKSYRGEDCVDWFVSELAQFAEDVETVFLCDLPMDPLTVRQKREFQKASHCHICESPFSNNLKHPDYKKVRDHCHLTGKFRGASHNKCNINYRDKQVIPTVFHNLSGYDSHFFIKDLAQKVQGKVDLLPVNKEKFISFTKNLDGCKIKFRFIDSFRFMNRGLDELARNLSEFPILRQFFFNPEGRMSDDEAYDYDENTAPPIDENKFKLLTRKGVYPYDYFSCFEKFSETELPPIEAFYNKLNDTHISPASYSHALNVWKVFECKTLGDYSDLYLKTDILLLAEVFEQFRTTCIGVYSLDPAHYYTLPGYTWDAMLKYTKVELELLTDVDMIMFIERGIRGGLSQCTLRFAKGNNPHLSDYDANKPESYLFYCDQNNQYGWGMSQPLPYEGFEWVADEKISEWNNDIENFKKINFNKDSDIGYFFEVDLEYPTALHDLHRDLPFAPEHRAAPGCKEPKLMATLHDKSRYVIHYLALKQALDHGLKLKKIHRAIQFKQKPWLKCYIDLNTKLRASAKNEFEKDTYKLLNNAAFGKTMENIRNHSVVKLITKWEGRYGAGKLLFSPFYKNRMVLGENVVIIELNKQEIFFNKPIYVGMAILDLAKTAIYEFHYDYMKVNAPNCVAAYTDTDAICYLLNKSPYDLMKKDCHQRFDTSDYSEDNIWGIPRVNKKVLGLLKDECKGDIMRRFVGLRAKMYAMEIETLNRETNQLENVIIKKDKGVKKNIIKTRISFNDYVRCLQNFTGVIIDDTLTDSSTKLYISQNLIQSKEHKVSSVTMPKLALSPDDDKRFLIPNSFETLPWGHYSIESFNQEAQLIE